MSLFRRSYSSRVRRATMRELSPATRERKRLRRQSQFVEPSYYSESEPSRRRVGPRAVIRSMFDTLNMPYVAMNRAFDAARHSLRDIKGVDVGTGTGSRVRKQPKQGKKSLERQILEDELR